MKVKYVGLADRRTVSSTDFPEIEHYPEAWVIDWGPGDVREVPPEVAEFLINRQRGEFRSDEVDNSDLAKNAQAEEAGEAVTPDEQGVDVQPAEVRDEAFQPDAPPEVEQEPDGLVTDPHELDALNKSEMREQMQLRKLDHEGMTRAAMRQAIDDHDPDLSDEPEEG